MIPGAQRPIARRKLKTKRRSARASWLSIISTSITAPTSSRSSNRYTQYLFSPSQKRWLLAMAAACALFCLYFFGLTDTGLLGPDEPRYAAIGRDMAPRLPVALMSVGFLLFFWFAVRREFGERVAWFAAAILATSAGWLAFSHVAVTDLPMAACFGASMLMLIGDRRRL